MDRIIERLKTLESEAARYAYADAVTNALLTAQIKGLREERELTQEKLAELVGTRQSGISRWLNSGFSACKVETLRRFGRAFGVRVVIRFEPFGTLPEDVRRFDEKNLVPPKFADDPAFNEGTAEQARKAPGGNALRQLARTEGSMPQTLANQPISVGNALVQALGEQAGVGTVQIPEDGLRNPPGSASSSASLGGKRRSLKKKRNASIKADAVSRQTRRRRMKPPVRVHLRGG